jgi:hypothetical protein
MTRARVTLEVEKKTQSTDSECRESLRVAVKREKR